MSKQNKFTLINGQEKVILSADSKFGNKMAQDTSKNLCSLQRKQ